MRESQYTYNHILELIQFQTGPHEDINLPAGINHTDGGRET